MTHKLFTPAASLSAIAAVLTFSTPALSQPDVIPPQGDVAQAPALPASPPPVVTSPPVTIESIPPATAQPSPATPSLQLTPTITPPASASAQPPRVVYEQRSPVVQDVPVTEEASPAEQAALTSSRSAQRTTPQSTTRSDAAPAPANPATNEIAETTPAAPASSGDLAPLAPPADTAATTADVAPVAPVENAEAGNADLSEGAMIGGAALLLLGTGGLAWFALRRRRPAAKAERPVVAKERTVPAAAVPVTASEPVRREEVTATAMSEPAPVLAPVTPSELHARNEDVTVLERPAVRSTTASSSNLEEMVSAQPDAANPFLTRRNRLRRARYIQANGEYVSRPMSARDETSAAATQAAVNQTHSRSQQPVYDFGKGAGPQRRPGWKPATST